MRAFLLALAACSSSRPEPTTTPITNVAPAASPAPASGLRLASIEPNRGDVDGGTYVRIVGTGFLAEGVRNAKVYFGNRQGTVVRFASDSELIVEAPGGKPDEVVDVIVIFDPGGQQTLRSAFTFIERRP